MYAGLLPILSVAMSGLVECSLYGCTADVVPLEERMAAMGAAREEGCECHTLYAPSPDGEHEREAPSPTHAPLTPRTSSLLRLIIASNKRARLVSYRAGDFGTEERTNVMNVTECALLEDGSSAGLEDLLSSLDYSCVAGLNGIAFLADHHCWCRPVKCTEYTAIRFTLTEVATLCLLRTGAGTWLVKLSGRCADKLGVPAVETSLFTVASYLDE